MTTRKTRGAAMIVSGSTRGFGRVGGRTLVGSAFFISRSIVVSHACPAAPVARGHAADQPVGLKNALVVNSASAFEKSFCIHP